MPNPDRDPVQRRMPAEPGPQPDPMLHEGPADGARKWGVSFFLAALVLAVMYGITAHRAEVQDEHRQAGMKQDVSPSANVPGPANRNTPNAPANPATTKPGG